MQNFIAMIARAEKNQNNSNLGWTRLMGTLYKKKQLKILKHSWSAALKSQERQNGGSAEVKRQRCNNLLLFLQGQKKKQK
jgi:hypothetical protein